MNSPQQLEFDKIKLLIKRECHSIPAQKRCERIKPLSNKQRIEHQLILISELQQLLKEGKDHNFEGMEELSSLFKEYRHETYGFDEFKQFYLNVKIGNSLYEKLQREKNYPESQDLVLKISPLPSIELKFQQIFDLEGNVKDHASEELFRIRNRKKGVQAKIRNLMNTKLEEFESGNYLQDKIITERDGRLVIPIKEGSINYASGIVHGKSASGASIYMEPAELVPVNNEKDLLDADEKHEIYRIFKEFSQQIKSQQDLMQENTQILTEFDFLFACARFANRIKSEKPEIIQKPTLSFLNARHPLLIEQYKDQKKVIPFNLELGQEFKIIIISGPNTGGKTVTLKSIGLLTMMALSGLPIPAAEGTKIGMFDHILADIGDYQSLFDSLSTFSSHISNIKEMLDKGSEKTLVLIDEIGAATDPEQGASLAQAILEKLVDKKLIGVITTHYTDLKIFAEKDQNCVNAAMQFDPQRHLPTYAFKLGLPGDSFAIEVAAELGLEKELIERAKELTGEQKIELAEILKKIASEKSELARQNYQYKLKSSLLDMKISEHEQRLDDIDKTTREIRKKSLREAKDYLISLQKELNREIEEIKKADKQARKQMLEETLAKTAALNKNLHREEKKITPHKYEPLNNPELGMRVWVDDLETEGEIIEILSEQVKVDINGIFYTVGKRKLYKVPDKVGVENKHSKVISKPKSQAQFELKLLGYRFEEALPELDSFLDKAYLSGLDLIRIVHGKGTGALRSKIREYLRKNKIVEEFYSPAPSAGGDGVTIAKLK